MHELANVIPTDTPDGTGPKLAGDWRDDDAQIINELGQDHAEPPAPDELPDTPRPTPLTQPKPLTRMLTGSLGLLPGWSPQQLLPADPARTSLQLWAASATATDYAQLADDPGKLQRPGSSALLYSGQLLTFPLTAPGGHTGPIWVSCPDATGPVTVSFLAVTR